MNLKHLGDALDHWKGAVINAVGVKTLRIVPMLTDSENWTQEDFSAYARLLRRKSRDLVKKKQLFSNQTRDGYFCGLGNEDLFLDPDTGIAPDRKRKQKHVSPFEIAGLLPKGSSRMLLIYQHASRKKNSVRDKLSLLRSAGDLRDCGLFAYDSGPVAMVVISRNRKRTKKAQARLKFWLGPAAKRRIIK
jgi:hypothetical protein